MELDTPTSAGCRKIYNYKHPHPCRPGVDCAFVVKWQEVEEEGWVEYEVTASLAGLNLATSLWVALGFSSNPDMVSVVSSSEVVMSMCEVLLCGFCEVVVS